MKSIFVGNLPFAATDDEVRGLFDAFGEVQRVTVIKDESGRSRGYGFVDMPVDIEADEAIAGLQGERMGGRALNVNEARPRKSRAERA